MSEKHLRARGSSVAAACAVVLFQAAAAQAQLDHATPPASQAPAGWTLSPTFSGTCGSRGCTCPAELTCMPTPEGAGGTLDCWPPVGGAQAQPTCNLGSAQPHPHHEAHDPCAEGFGDRCAAALRRQARRAPVETLERVLELCVSDARACDLAFELHRDHRECDPLLARTEFVDCFAPAHETQTASCSNALAAYPGHAGLAIRACTLGRQDACYLVPEWWDLATRACLAGSACPLPSSPPPAEALLTIGNEYVTYCVDQGPVDGCNAVQAQFESWGPIFGGSTFTVWLWGRVMHDCVTEQQDPQRRCAPLSSERLASIVDPTTRSSITSAYQSGCASGGTSPGCTIADHNATLQSWLGRTIDERRREDDPASDDTGWYVFGALQAVSALFVWIPTWLDTAVQFGNHAGQTADSVGFSFIPYIGPWLMLTTPIDTGWAIASGLIQDVFLITGIILGVVIQPSTSTTSAGAVSWRGTSLAIAF